MDILKISNEKLAIGVFTNGLSNPELRTVVKARNYSTIKDAINGAKDEERSKYSSVPQIMHIRPKQFAKRHMREHDNQFPNKGHNRKFSYENCPKNKNNFGKNYQNKGINLNGNSTNNYSKNHRTYKGYHLRGTHNEQNTVEKFFRPS